MYILEQAHTMLPTKFLRMFEERFNRDRSLETPRNKMPFGHHRPPVCTAKETTTLRWQIKRVSSGELTISIPQPKS